MLKKSVHRHSLVFVILFFGLVLRLININQSLWLDEAISAQAAVNFTFSQLLFRFLPQDVHPPLYQLMLFFWLKIFPQSEIFLRLPNIIFGLLTCIFIYRLDYLLFKNKKQAFFSFVFLLISPLHIYYSQEARMYSLTAFLTIGSMYYFLRFFRTGSWREVFFYSFYTVLNLYTHYLSFLTLAVQGLYFLSRTNKKKDEIRFFLGALALNLTLYFPWIRVFVKQMEIGYQAANSNKIWGQTVGGLSLKNIFLLPIKFIIGRTNFENQYFYFLAALVLILLFSFLVFRALKDKKNSLILGLWLGLPPLLGIIISLKTPVFSYHRFLYCLPAFIILFNRGIFLFRRKKIIDVFLILIIGINLFFSGRYLFDTRFHRENWKKAVAVLNQENRLQAPVLILDNVAPPFDYYDQGRSKKVYLYQKEAISGFAEVWLIPYALPIFDPNDETRQFLVNNGFNRVYEEHFQGVTLEKWLH